MMYQTLVSQRLKLNPTSTNCCFVFVFVFSEGEGEKGKNWQVTYLAVPTFPYLLNADNTTTCFIGLCKE